MRPNVDRLRYLRSIRQQALSKAWARYSAACAQIPPDACVVDYQDDELTAATRQLDEAQAALDLVESALADLRLLRVCMWTPPASVTAAEGARV